MAICRSKMRLCSAEEEEAWAHCKDALRLCLPWPLGVQASGPIYKLVSTNVGGEHRFVAAVARRLQSLGALTRGDRRAASGLDLSTSNFDTSIGRKALRRGLFRRFRVNARLVQRLESSAGPPSRRLPLLVPARLLKGLAGCLAAEVDCQASGNASMVCKESRLAHAAAT
jgi:C-terminal domain on Strawberry notch homologue